MAEQPTKLPCRQRVANCCLELRSAFTTHGREFEMVDMDIGGVTMKGFKHLPPNVSQSLRPFFDKYAARTWLMCHDSDERYTFGEAARISDAIGAALCHDFDVKLGDKVAIAMANWPESMMAFIAAQHIGATAVMFVAERPAEVEYHVKNSGPKVIILDPAMHDMLRRCSAPLGLRVVLCRSDEAVARRLGATCWEEVLRLGEGKTLPSLGALTEEDDAMLLYTSGTTGMPKGVCQSQRSFSTSIKLGHIVANISADPKLVMPDRINYISGVMNGISRAIPGGSCLIMMPDWDPGLVIDLIEREQLRRIWGRTSMILDILEHPAFEPRRVASLKSIAVGGDAVPPILLKRVYDKVPNVIMIHGYGCTEMSALSAMNIGANYVKRPTSVGRPCLLMDIKIKDRETGEIMPDGQRGEVCVKSITLMRCYHLQPELTRKVIDKDGYFHTEDVGKMEGGFLYILGRYKDVFYNHGLTVDCAEVEAGFYEHPAVRQCCVFGLPHPRIGQVPAAAVWVQEAVTQADLNAHADAIMSWYKVPDPSHIFMHTTELPKVGFSGKLDKKGLRDHYCKQVGPLSDITEAPRDRAAAAEVEAGSRAQREARPARCQSCCLPWLAR